MVCYVYLMRDGEGRIKIGKSKDPQARAKYISYAYCRVELIWFLECKDATRTERAMHNRFRQYHITHEWFGLPDDVIEWVKAQTEEALCEGYNGGGGRPGAWYTNDRWL